MFADMTEPCTFRGYKGKAVTKGLCGKHNIALAAMRSGQVGRARSGMGSRTRKMMTN